MTLRAFRFDLLIFICNRVVSVFPGSRLRMLFYRRVMQLKMGEGVNILSGTWIDCRGNFEIKGNCVINQNCRLDNRGGISIGLNVSISPEVHLITADHDMDDPLGGGRTGEITIGDFVFIGSRATILPGVTIGEGAVVAACACVTKDVPEYTMVGGVPAKEIRKRPRGMTYTAEYCRHFI